MAAATPARFLGRLRANLRRRIAAYARKRQGEDRLPVTLRPGRVYILPTRAGVAFAALVFVMLVAGLNYSNSIALLFTFLLAGFGLIAMHLTHRNLAGLAVRTVATVDGFAGEHGRLLLMLENAADTARLGIECETALAEPACTDVAAAGSARADLAVALEFRGPVPVERLTLATRFPFGLFRAWSYAHLPLRLLAWPVPRGRREPPAEAASGGATAALHRAGDEEWHGLRAFRDGDSPRQVAWAAYARGRGLLVKTYQSPAAHHRTFDLGAVPGADLEARLEQLAAWIEGAHARGERYGLRLGAVEIAVDAGEEHRRRCLDELALFGKPDPRGEPA